MSPTFPYIAHFMGACSTKGSSRSERECNEYRQPLTSPVSWVQVRIAHCTEEKERFTAEGFTMLPQDLNQQSPQCVCVWVCECVRGCV